MRNIEQLLSQSRLDPYQVATSGTTVEPLELYDWNSQVGSAFFESLHYLEVGLRNSIDDAVRKHSAVQLGLNSWLRSDGPLLSHGSRQQVALAERRIQRAGRPVTHGRVVAELSFGFWWSLFAQEYNRSLWQPALRHAFEGSVRRQKLHDELGHFRVFRNRIAHHEPIFTRDLQGDWARLLDLGGRIAEALAQRMRITSRVPDLLAVRPSTR